MEDLGPLGFRISGFRESILHPWHGHGLTGLGAFGVHLEIRIAGFMLVAGRRGAVQAYPKPYTLNFNPKP